MNTILNGEGSQEVKHQNCCIFTEIVFFSNIFSTAKINLVQRHLIIILSMQANFCKGRGSMDFGKCVENTFLIELSLSLALLQTCFQVGTKIVDRKIFQCKLICIWQSYRSRVRRVKHLYNGCTDIDYMYRILNVPWLSVVLL